MPELSKVFACCGILQLTDIQALTKRELESLLKDAFNHRNYYHMVYCAVPNVWTHTVKILKAEGFVKKETFLNHKSGRKVSVFSITYTTWKKRHPKMKQLRVRYF